MEGDPIWYFFGPVAFHPYDKPITKFLHIWGINFEAYIDNCILAQLDPDTLVKHLEFPQKLLQQLGLLVNMGSLRLIPLNICSL